MGYMTEVGILNDRWEEIRRRPAEFVEQIYQSSMSCGREPQWIIGQTTVAKTHHADDHRVYLAHQNSFCELTPEKDWNERRLELHDRDLKLIRQYLKYCEKRTKELLDQARDKRGTDNSTTARNLIENAVLEANKVNEIS